MKNFTATIYTTHPFFNDELPRIRQELCKAKGVGDIEFYVIPIDFSELKDYYPDVSHVTGVNFPWLKQNIFKGATDIECLHISQEERDIMKMTHPTSALLGGEYDVDKDNVLDFVVIANEGQMAYDGLTEFQRIFIHEACHGFSHWTTNDAMGLVHYYDGQTQQILKLPAIYDFTRHTILSMILGLLKEMLVLKNKRMTLIEAGEKFLEKDASPLDSAPDELGCADSVSEVIKTIFPTFKGSIGTFMLNKIFSSDKRFVKIDKPEPNAIIICVTGESADKVVTHGHVGIIGLNGRIMSNSSATGTWEYNYTLDSWKTRWVNYPIHYYKIA